MNSVFGSNCAGMTFSSGNCGNSNERQGPSWNSDHIMCRLSAVEINIIKRLADYKSMTHEDRSKIIEAIPIGNVLKNLSSREIEGLENALNIYLSNCADGNEASAVVPHELYVSLYQYQQLLKF